MIGKRLRLFEFVDLDWFPGSVRDAATDLLRLSWETGSTVDPIVRRLARLLEITGERELLDLGSGGGGPARLIQRELRRSGHDVRITLSDKYPNFAAYRHLQRLTGGDVDYVREPVDVASVPEHLAGARTMFASLHHFSPDTISAMLEASVVQRRPIALFDLTARRLPPIPMLLLTNPLGVLLATPFVRPVRPRHLLLTYIVPVVPLFMLWDGMMSGLRLYSVDELQAIVRDLPVNDYCWEIGSEPFPSGITYLVGFPNGDGPTT